MKTLLGVAFALAMVGSAYAEPGFLRINSPGEAPDAKPVCTVTIRSHPEGAQTSVSNCTMEGPDGKVKGPVHIRID